MSGRFVFFRKEAHRHVFIIRSVFRCLALRHELEPYQDQQKTLSEFLEGFHIFHVFGDTGRFGGPFNWFGNGMSGLAHVFRTSDSANIHRTTSRRI